MEISEFTFRLILIFIPGLITFYIVDKLTIHKETVFHDKVFYSLLYGFICYMGYSFVVSIISFFLPFHIELSFFKSLTDNSIKPDLKEILWATILSFPIGFLFSFISNHKFLHRIAHKLSVSKKFGDVGVWSYLMNTGIPEWVVVRDIQNDLMYEGWVMAFSDSTEEHELFLRDVKVFRNSTGDPLYETPGLYIPRKREFLIVEFPNLGYTEYKDRPRK